MKLRPSQYSHICSTKRMDGRESVVGEILNGHPSKY